MLFLYCEKITDTKAKVTGYHHRPNELDETTKQQGVLVEDGSIPADESQMGQYSELFVNPQTKELWREYFDRPLTPEEELQQLKQRQELVQKALDELILGGM
jgi:hypothetical protein